MGNDELHPIPGYEGRYAITRSGRIWSYPKSFARRMHEGMWLRPGFKQGYPQVVLVDAAGKRKTVRVHRLVAQVFIPNPLGLTELNHIDSDPGNPSADNLEWCTRSQNITHSYRSGKKRGRASMDDATLAQVRAALAAGEQNKSIALRFGVCETSLPAIKQGRLYAHR